MKKRVLLGLLVVLSVSFFAYKKKTRKPVIDVVFCIDFSNSTNGVSALLKDQIWGSVNNFLSMNPQPDVRVGIVGYGRPSFGGKDNYIRIISDLTSDIDEAMTGVYTIEKSTNNSMSVSDQAFSICLKKLDWHSKNNFKQLFFIGNGPLGSSYDNLYDLIPKAMKKNIGVQMVYLDNNQKRLGFKGWEELANLSGDSLKIINIEKALNYSIAEGSEEMLVDAGSLLNETYIYYGVSGDVKKAQMEMIDNETNKTGKRGQKERIVFKASNLFQGKNDSWDLVDFSRSPYFDIAKVDKRLLPKDYQRLTDEMLLERILLKRDDREQLIGVIQMLSSKLKNDYHQKTLDKKSLTVTLQDVIISTFNDKANEHGFEVM